MNIPTTRRPGSMGSLHPMSCISPYLGHVDKVFVTECTAFGVCELESLDNAMIGLNSAGNICHVRRRQVVALLRRHMARGLFSGERKRERGRERERNMFTSDNQTLRSLSWLIRNRLITVSSAYGILSSPLQFVGSIQESIRSEFTQTVLF